MTYDVVTTAVRSPPHMLRITALSYAIRRCTPGDETSWLHCRVLSFLGTSHFGDVKRAKPAIAVPCVEFVAVGEDGSARGVMDVTVKGALATVDTVAVHPGPPAPGDRPWPADEGPRPLSERGRADAGCLDQG
jgi:hypothetical protein